jgi:hypothetical protein
MTEPQAFGAGIGRQIGRYADAVRVPAAYDQIMASGTPGLAPDGTLAGLGDIVAVRQWLTRAEGIPAYAAVRSKFISHRPAFLLGVTPAPVWPGFLVEIEVAAAVPAAAVPAATVPAATVPAATVPAGNQGA